MDKKPNKKNLFLPISALAILGMLISGAAYATGTAAVAATVTVQSLSIAVVANSTIDYGVLPSNTDMDTTSGGMDKSPTLDNDGNDDTEILLIRGQNSTNWYLSTTSTAQNQYRHYVCTSTCDGTPSWMPMSGTNKYLKHGMSSSTNMDMDLKITTPNPSTVFTAQDVDVTVTASAS